MAKKAAGALSAFDLLIDPTLAAPAPACAIVGDDGFLQHEVRRALVTQFCGAGEESSAQLLDGETAQLRDVLDALSELSLFGGALRVVVVEQADKLVKEYRAQLEDYVARPARGAVLILEVSAWPANTRLAKAVAASGLTVNCQMPSKAAELNAFHRKLKEWLAVVARRDFDVQLEKSAAETLLELLPSEPGVLYQEVGRLALLAAGDAKGRSIDGKLVRQQVGGWRTQQTWDMIDAAADGRAAEALVQLDLLLAAGEEPQGVLPQMAFSLRKFALAVRLYDQAERRGRGMSPRDALQRAGIFPSRLDDAERQLRQIGRPRARQLYQWLLAADLELKGYNSPRERARRVLETLIVRLSKEAQAAAAGSAGGRS